MLEAVRGRFGDTVGESSTSEKARDFKRRNFGREIDAEFIDEREALYLELSSVALARMDVLQNLGKDVITSDSSLVTRLSHNVMREVRLGKPLDVDKVVSDWRTDESVVGAAPPDMLVLACPPFSVVQERIEARQRAGDKLESFVGFNSLDFLHAYRDGWRRVLPTLLDHIPVALEIDSSVTSVTESVEMYSEARGWIASEQLV